MDVQQARQFLALAEELHFSRAAQRLNMAQPPLSRAIKALEKEFNCQLFTRSTRRVELTAAGEALVDPARRLVQAAEDAGARLRGVAAGVTGSVRVGFAGTSTMHFVAGLTRAVAKNHPGINLELHAAQFSDAGLQRVLDGSLDTAVGRWDFLPADIDSVVIGQERMLAAVPDTHPLAQRERISLAELASDRWIVLPLGSGGALQNRITALTRAAGFHPGRSAASAARPQVAPDSSTMLVLVEAGMGVAVTLDSVRDTVRTRGVKFLELTESDTVLEVRLIWKHSSTNQALRTIIPTATALRI